MKPVAVVKRKADVNGNVAEPVVAKPALSVVKSGHLFRKAGELITAKDLIELGADHQFLERKGERMVAVDIDKGGLYFGGNAHGNIRDTLIQGQILGTAALTSDVIDYKVLVVFTDERTYFLIMPNGKLFGFYVPEKSTNLQEAVLNLLLSNLARGQEAFEKTANRLYPDHLFLFELFKAVYEESIISFTLRSPERNSDATAEARLYFYPEQRSRTILSIGGWCYDFNFLDYPKYFRDAFLRVKTSKGKVEHKLGQLTLNQAGMMKPVQKPRNEKEAQVDPENTKKLVEELSTTMRKVREHAHDPRPEKRVRDMPRVTKQPKAPKDGGKKKKK